MSLEQQIRQCLAEIEPALCELGLWQPMPPTAEAFTSAEPFCLDTMAAEQWLQWVLLPRMAALLDRGGPLPSRFMITPYFEEALSLSPTDAQRLLQILRRLDDLLNIDNR